MITDMRSVTHHITLSILASLLVEKRRRKGRRRRIRKERSMLPEVHLRRTINLGKRTQLVSKIRKRSSKAFRKHYGRSAGKRQFV
jgi:hypothetical protein